MVNFQTTVFLIIVKFNTINLWGLIKSNVTKNSVVDQTVQIKYKYRVAKYD